MFLFSRRERKARVSCEELLRPAQNDRPSRSVAVKRIITAERKNPPQLLLCLFQSHDCNMTEERAKLTAQQESQRYSPLLW